MVLGKISNFTEGFQSFTADDELMIANLKQALEYSKESLSIPDPSSKLNLLNNKNTNITNNTNITKQNTNVNNMTTTTQMAIPTAIPTNMLNNNTKNNNIFKELNNTPTIPKLNNTPTIPKLNNTPIIPKLNMTPQTTNQMSNNSISTMSQTQKNKPMESKNNTSATNTKQIAKFEDIKKVKYEAKNTNNNDYDNYNEDDDSDVDDIAELEEDEYPKTFQDKYSKTRRQNSMDSVEGFQGSLYIESQYLKNVLLALLLTAIGYLIAQASINNLLPLNNISPQLKKFKNLIYGFIFFCISYICLEIF